MNLPSPLVCDDPAQPIYVDFFFFFDLKFSKANKDGIIEREKERNFKKLKWDAKSKQLWPEQTKPN